jgi:hypothetical protein
MGEMPILLDRRKGERETLLVGIKTFSREYLKTDRTSEGPERFLGFYAWLCDFFHWILNFSPVYHSSPSCNPVGFFAFVTMFLALSFPMPLQ